MNSGIEETLVDRMGSSWLAASISTFGRPSRSPSLAMREGSTDQREADFPHDRCLGARRLTRETLARFHERADRAGVTGSGKRHDVVCVDKHEDMIVAEDAHTIGQLGPPSSDTDASLLQAPAQ